jgi:hypothetical protein
MEKPLIARSRTFIRASLKDNPDMAATDYDAVLSRLPPHLRAAYRDGRFDLALKERARQVIPTDWVRAAMERWQPRPPEGLPMSSMGVDVAGGGSDSTVIAPRYDGWYPPMVAVKGAETKDGPAMAGLVMSKRRDNALVIIDMGGGYGGSVYDHLKENGITCYAYKGSHKSFGKTADGQMRFANTRSEAYWKFREALDPGQPFGSRIELPKDNELLADLCAPEFTVKSNGYQITPKETLVEKLGRSPDKGDAVVMSWFKGDKLENHTWQKGEQGGILRRPKGMVVNMGPRRSK